MADPFEVRMRFTSQLQHLNASVTSSQKAAHYALKYRDMDEDLHSCILEQLERNSMNNRANIMFFIEHLCDMAQRENHMEYVNMMRRDILRVVDAVAPEDGSGAANVKVIRRVLQGLQQKSILEPQNVLEIEACLKERDTLPANAVLSPASPRSVVAGDDGDGGGGEGGGGGGGCGGSGAEHQQQQQQQLSLSSASSTTRRLLEPAAAATAAATASATPASAAAAAAAAAAATANTPRSSRPNGGAAAAPAKKLDKRQIEQRIEEDRERHKRFRESIWAVGGDDDAEFDRLWDEASELGEDDYLAAEEDKIEREAAEVAACR